LAESSSDDCIVVRAAHGKLYDGDGNLGFDQYLYHNENCYQYMYIYYTF